MTMPPHLPIKYLQHTRDQTMSDIVNRLLDAHRGWHPDQVEAADELKRLRADNAALILALENSSNRVTHEAPRGMCFMPESTPREMKALKTKNAALKADAERLAWLARAGEVSLGIVVDAAHDGDYYLCADVSRHTGYGKTLRDAIDAAMKVKP